MVTILVAMVTNYVTANPPKWAENNLVVWSVIGALAVVSIGLLFWERRLGGEPEGAGRPLAPLGRIAAAASNSTNPPAVSAPVRGRDAELEQIGWLVRGRAGGMVVVCGAGGLGKTTVAAEAASQARTDGRVVVWIRWRDDPAQLAQDMTHAAHILGMPEARLEEARTGRASLVDAVWEHLASVAGWLIVIDNVDAPARIGPGTESIAAYRGWLRPDGAGILLVTSRDTSVQTWGSGPVLIPLDPLADEAGAKVLLDAAPHAGPEPEAEALSVRLGGLPLALDAAGTYLAIPTSRHRTFTTYRQALDAEFGDLLGAEHPAAAANPETARQLVRHTSDLSLDQLEEDGYTLARPILQLLSLFALAPLPRALITPDLVAESTRRPATAAAVDAALAGLHQYGLLNAPQSTDASSAEFTVGQLHLHPLVREVTAHTVPRPQPTEAWLTALDQHLAQAVATTINIPGRGGWPTARLLAPLLPSYLGRATPDNFAAARETVNNLARVLRVAGAGSEYLLLRRSDLEAAILHLGPEHPDTLMGRNHLASALGGLGEHQQAVDLHRQVLADRERILGSDHPDTLTSRNNLADALSALGEYQEALDLHRQTLADHERILGSDHPDTLTSRNNLANALGNLGEYQQALDLHRQVLADRERILGPHHPATLTSRNNLADTLSDLGERRQALDLHRQVLADRERILGSDHPDTLTSRNNLAAAEAAALTSTFPAAWRRWVPWQR
ncbi:MULTISPECIES: tetratricopeptide repeat protein [Streptomyces]|uniref:tetratricopeptide repeat protein n=1 Tax=Streptomyces TaxID=1883 RepID=UPI002E282C38|nr:tetratricopeptide repeat protein [[Kitasatospora] papulosa]